MFCRKNNGLPPEPPEACRIAIDYRKLDVITKYPRHPLPLMGNLIENVPHTRIMSTLDLMSEYFQLVVNPRDIPKTELLVNKYKHCIFRNMFSDYFRSFQIYTCEALKCHQHIDNGHTYQAFYPGTARKKGMTCIAGGL
ncbi:hypothetical protein TNCV_219351 [Trichonephila clavipes]|nr:hypothetical protein TNCV_219351 [Trichonephila clavipes]